jgi:hypothetical protein
MKLISLPVRPHPVELVPVVSHRIEYQIGDSRGVFDITASLVRERPATRKRKRAAVRPIHPRDSSAGSEIGEVIAEGEVGHGNEISANISEIERQG